MRGARKGIAGAGVAGEWCLCCEAGLQKWGAQTRRWMRSGAPGGADSRDSHRIDLPRQTPAERVSIGIYVNPRCNWGPNSGTGASTRPVAAYRQERTLSKAFLFTSTAMEINEAVRMDTAQGQGLLQLLGSGNLAEERDRRAF